LKSSSRLLGSMKWHEKSIANECDRLHSFAIEPRRFATNAPRAGTENWCLAECLQRVCGASKRGELAAPPVKKLWQMEAFRIILPLNFHQPSAGGAASSPHFIKRRKILVYWQRAAWLMVCATASWLQCCRATNAPLNRNLVVRC
jgi:hypothetical protein